MSRKSKATEFQDSTYDVSVIGRNVEVTDALRDHAIEKISKLERFSDRIIEAFVSLDVQKIGCRVDITLRAGNLKIKSQAVAEDMYAGIDLAVRKLEAQLLRYKNKIQDHQSKHISEIEMEVNVLRSIADNDLTQINEEIEFENKQRLIDKYRPHKIVSKERRTLSTLTDGEALMKLDLADDLFLIYRDEVTRNIRVLYRRNDDDFGVIEVKI